MPIIQSSGLGTSALSNETVDKIINAEKKDIEKRHNQEIGLVKARITAYGKLKSSLSKFQTAVDKLADPKVAGALVASSSDKSIVDVDADDTAKSGIYNLQVNNIAKSHSIASKRFTSEYSVVGTGKLTFSFGANQYDGAGNLTGQSINSKRPSKTLVIDSSNNTLTGIRNAINNANMGVSASIINDGTGFRLSLKSTETGADNAMQITAQDASGNALTSGLGALNFNTNQQGTGFAQQTTKGEDARLEVNGLAISRSSNTVKGVIDGVTLNLKSADVSKQVQISIKPDAEKIKKGLEEFVKTYNEVKKILDDVTQYDTVKNKAGILIGDNFIRSLQARISQMISSPIKGLGGQEYTTLASLGVESDRNNKFDLMFTPSKFYKAMSANSQNVRDVLSESGRTSDSQVQFMNSSIGSKPGTYDIEITRLAKRASFTTASVASLNFASPVQIGQNNDEFSINVDGKAVAVNLRHGSYSTGENLAEEITQKINGALSGTGKSVTVEYNQTDKNFTFTSNQYGSNSQISFTSVENDVASMLGFNPVGQGAYMGKKLASLGVDALVGKGASTQIGSASVSEQTGINFALTNATFALKVDGAPAVNVTVNQNAQGQDLNGDGVFGDRKDTLQAIQNGIDATSLNGKVQASFDKNGYLVFATTQVGSARSIEISAVGSSGSDQLLGLQDSQGVQSNGKDAGITLSSPAQFKVKVDGTQSTATVSIAAGTYNTGADLASAIQTQLAATFSSDAAFSGKVAGAATDTGSRNISSNIDFAANPSGFVVNVNGVEKEVIVNSGATNNIANVQAALDSSFGAGVVTASLDGTGLKLTTAVTGHDKFIEVKEDGRGARTSAFADMSAGVDFSGANKATFTLAVGGKDINVEVNENASAGGAQANLIAVQNGLNQALDVHPDFAVGDVVAKLDSSNKIYFETVSQKGIKNASTYGKNASIEVKGLGGTAATSLGMATETKTNGYDSFGLNKNRKYGYDLTPQVSFKQNNQDKTGHFEISVGGSTTRVRFADLNTEAISKLGLQDEANYQPEVAKGQDVAGKINGQEASGKGQYLRGIDGNIKAKNGFYIAQKAYDFSTGTPLTIDNTNNKFKVKVDGVETEVELALGTKFTNGKTLAKAIEVAINTSANIVNKKLKVKVEYTDDPSAFAHQKLSIISGSTGAESSVEITEISSAASTALGFVKGLADGEKGADQVGQEDPSSGIRVKVLGGALGKRGTVTYVSGFADQLKSIMKGFLDTTSGSVVNGEKNLKAEQTKLEKEHKEFTARMDARKEQMMAKFRYNDAIVSKLNTTLDYLKQQFAVMNGTKK